MSVFVVDSNWLSIPRFTMLLSVAVGAEHNQVFWFLMPDSIITDMVNLKAVGLIAFLTASTRRLEGTGSGFSPVLGSQIDFRIPFSAIGLGFHKCNGVRGGWDS